MFLWIVALALGKSNFDESDEYILETEEKYDHDLAQSILPYVKWAYIIITIIRVALFVISYKKPKVCRLYLYFELIIMLLDCCMPKNISL